MFQLPQSWQYSEIHILGTDCINKSETVYLFKPSEIFLWIFYEEKYNTFVQELKMKIQLNMNVLLSALFTVYQ